MKVISAKNLHYSYGNLSIFSGLNFSILQNEFVGIVGPSGCGKTTLLSILSGLLKPQQGILDNHFKPYETSFVFQEPALMPWCSIKKNISLPLELLQNSSHEERNEKVDKVLKLVKLENFGDYYPRQLSGGMKMRASLARALVTDPHFLILDEPFAALDEIVREEMVQSVHELWNERKRTTLIVTHNISEAVFLCDRIFVFSQRPANVLTEIEIKTDLPRDEHFRRSSLFMEKCFQVKKFLKEAFL